MENLNKNLNCNPDWGEKPMRSQDFMIDQYI